jgi:cation:H+ antiporter
MSHGSPSKAAGDQVLTVVEPPPGQSRSWAIIGAMAVIGFPGLAARLAGIHFTPALGAVVFGLAILAAAFLLSWGAETAEMDIGQGLAVAIIALIAVLPEYAVDLVLAWQAGRDPAEAERGLAIANMTGGNRLLIGLGWPLVFLLFWIRTRSGQLIVDRQRSLELAFLTVATLYVLFIPLRSHLTLMDTIVLVSLFIIYMILTSRVEGEEHELVGPARTLGSLGSVARRVAIVVLLVYSAAVIFTSAEPFAEALVELGQEFGISEFLLIQWLAPLASESPEVLVAGLLAWRGRAAVGMGALISSKVNQWTLLIGTLPIAFSIASGRFDLFGGLPLDHRQREEILLTAAQSAFAIAVFVNLRMSPKEATALFVLFATQLFLTDERIRLIFSAAYMVICIALLIMHRDDVRRTTGYALDIILNRERERAPAPPEHHQ